VTPAIPLSRHRLGNYTTPVLRSSLHTPLICNLAPLLSCATCLKLLSAEALKVSARWLSATHVTTASQHVYLDPSCLGRRGTQSFTTGKPRERTLSNPPSFSHTRSGNSQRSEHTKLENSTMRKGSMHRRVQIALRSSCRTYYRPVIFGRLKCISGRSSFESHVLAWRRRWKCIHIIAVRPAEYKSSLAILLKSCTQPRSAPQRF
jgi:hypothetical protein